jgi:hypothetical protein
MGLEPLEFIERAQMRVCVIEPDDKADGHLVIFEMVQKRAAIGAAIHRPADRMGHVAGLVIFRLNFPQFLDADAIGLDVCIIPQIEFFEQGLGQRPVAALGKDRLFGMQFEPGLIIRRLFAVLADAHVAGCDAAHTAVFGIQHFGGGKAGIYLDTHGFGLFGEPAAHIAEADDVIAVIVHLGRCRQPYCAGFAEQQELIALDRGVQRRATVLPVGEQFGQRLWFQHGTGQNMRADL